VMVAVPQIAALVLHRAYDGTAPVAVIALAAAFVCIYVAAAIGLELRREGGRLGVLTTSLCFGAGALAVGASYRLFETAEQRGIALLMVAVWFGVLAFVFSLRRSGSELGSLLASVGLTVGALALGGLLSGDPLAYAWAAESAALAWLARRGGRVRFQLWSASRSLHSG
jgi:hypothetical protein